MRIVHLHVPKTAGTALRHAFQGLSSPKLRVCPARLENQFKNVNFDDFDFFSGHISFMLAEKIGGDYVAGMKLAEDVRVFDLVGHGHGIHEAGDGFVIDGDLGCGRIGGNDLAAQLEGLDRGSGC